MIGTGSIAVGYHIARHSNVIVGLETNQCY